MESDDEEIRRYAEFTYGSVKFYNRERSMRRKTRMLPIMSLVLFSFNDETGGVF